MHGQNTKPIDALLRGGEPMARQKKEFDENSKLGFMRLIQIYNVFSIVLFTILMIFVRGGLIEIDAGVAIGVILLLSQAVVVWLIAKRKIYTRQIVIGLEIFELVTIAAGQISDGAFDLSVFAANAVPPVIVILYFAFSRRAKAVLVQPWNDKSLLETQQARDREMWDPKSGEFWMRLLLYFFVFSILGHWMEMGVQVLVVNGLFPGTVAPPDSLTWRDNLNPFFIYGEAVAFCGAALYPIFLKLREKMPHQWQAYVVSFLINTLFCVVAELILGLAVNGDYHAWDYRDQFMNFMGQICLLYSFAFGVMSSLITWLLYPRMERAFSGMNRDRFRLVFLVSLVLFIIVVATYNIDIYQDMSNEEVAETYRVALEEALEEAEAEAVT